MEWKANLTKRHAIGPREVYTEACRLGEELGGPPTQGEIAANLGCTRQHVSNCFRTLEFIGIVEWRGRYVYRIVNSQWLPPTETEI